MKNVLTFSPTDAKEFFLKAKSYCEFELPPYFNFGDLITKLSAKLENINLKDCYSDSKPRDCSDVNYVLHDNKDGKYAWRPFQLIHPAIYVSLVHKITEETNWRFIVERFKLFAENEKIQCYSLPGQSESKESDKAEQVNIWFKKIEQQSIELSLEYECILEIDIADCYGSIYSHTIAWALHSKNEAKGKRKDGSLLGNIIDWHIQDMTCGQTNGLPQGSALMDFLAEMILGYADTLLTEELNKTNITDYKIIRYRDDYRIFVNNPHDADIIAKHLTVVLLGLGLKTNANKSRFSNEVVKSSIKPDKYFWISNKTQDRDHQKQLYIIHSLSQNYPNSGVLQKQLKKYYDRIKNGVGSHDNINVLIAILTDIAFKNPRTYSIVAAILSKLISPLPPPLQKSLVAKILKRFEKIPNTGYLQIWLQRVTLKLEDTYSYGEPLCNKVINDQVIIWNSEWLNSGLKDLINTEKIVDQKVIEGLPAIIAPKEVELFISASEY
jgi:hypothetical protein